MATSGTAPSGVLGLQARGRRSRGGFACPGFLGSQLSCAYDEAPGRMSYVIERITSDESNGRMRSRIEYLNVCRPDNLSRLDGVLPRAVGGDDPNQIALLYVPQVAKVGVS